MLNRLMTIVIVVLLALPTHAVSLCIKDDNGSVISCDGDKGNSWVGDHQPWQDRFFRYDEKLDMAHTFIGDVPVILDTDFIEHSTSAGRFLTDIFEIKHNKALFAVIERRDYKAVLVDQIGFNALTNETYGAGCNRSQCTSVIIGGALEGFVEGAALGATTGSVIGGPYGAAAGAVIGGGVMSTAKSISGYGNADACNCPDSSGSASGNGTDAGGSLGEMGGDDDPKDKETPKNEE